MPVQPIRLFGDPVLTTPADPVATFDKELRVLVKDLTETMLDAPGAGLAAPQIGVSLRVFAYDVDDVIGHLVNPVIGVGARWWVAPTKSPTPDVSRNRYRMRSLNSTSAKM